jgi:hypothetical protein
MRNSFLLSTSTYVTAQVNVLNWRKYVRCAEHVRLMESSTCLKAMKSGLAVVLPTEIFALSHLENSSSSSRECSLLNEMT